MAVELTSPAFGLEVGDTYTGPEEAWLLAEGYAKQAGYATKGVATLKGSAAAVNVVTGGAVVLRVNGVSVTATLANGDIPSAVVTKLNTALGAKATASLQSSVLQVVAAASPTGQKSSITVVSGAGTTLANLKLTAGTTVRGSDGGIGVANTGSTAVLPANDPENAANRGDKAFWPDDEAEFDGFANDGSGSESSQKYDWDQGGVNDDDPEILAVAPDEGPIAGGTVVTLTGTGFEGLTGVTFGGEDGTGLEVVSDFEAHVIAPAAEEAGAVDVVATNANGSDTLAGGFTYTA